METKGKALEVMLVLALGLRHIQSKDMLVFRNLLKRMCGDMSFCNYNELGDDSLFVRFKKSAVTCIVVEDEVDTFPCHWSYENNMSIQKDTITKMPKRH